MSGTSVTELCSVIGIVYKIEIITKESFYLKELYLIKKFMYLIKILIQNIMNLKQNK
jgi:hypothetical protein